MLNNSGIYALYWDTTDKIYIGQSINLHIRYRQHLNLLEKGKHNNYKMQEAYNLFGAPEYLVLRYCVPSALNINEVELIAEFNATIDGYNISKGGDSSFGEDHPNSIYTNSQVEEVFLKLLNRNTPQKEISLETGVSIDVVKAISRGSLHTWLEEKYPVEYKDLIDSKKDQHNSGENHAMSKYSNNEIEELFIKYLVDRSSNLTDISKVSGIDYNVISLVACGSRHRWLKDKYPNQYLEMLDNKGKVFNNYPLITNGTEIVQVENGTQFCKDRGLSLPNLCKVFKGTRTHHKGWRIYNG